MQYTKTLNMLLKVSVPTQTHKQTQTYAENNDIRSCIKAERLLKLLLNCDALTHCIAS
jgi:hypothetical protein